MTFASVRAVVESKINSAYQALTPAVPVMFDNVQETPPDLPYVVCVMSYVSASEPVICPGGGSLERLVGNLQLSCYVRRGQGMKQVEELVTAGWQAMDTMWDANASTRVKCGQVNGPTPLLDGPEPYALCTFSCQFQALVD